MNTAPVRNARLFVLLLVAALLIFGASAAFASGFGGRVVDVVTGKPVVGARVRVVESGDATVTDKDGWFYMEGIRPGPYTLSVHHIAYNDCDRPVAAVLGGAPELLVELTPAIYTTREVVVHSERTTATLHDSPCAAAVVDAGRLRDAPAVSVPEALARVPGVTLSRDGEWQTALSIRGLSRSNIVALVDGTRIEASTDVSGPLSLVDLADLERVEVMKSSGSVLFGSGSLGGAVHMVSRRPQFSDKPHAGYEVSEGLTSADRGVSHHVAFEAGGEELAMRVSGSLRNAADVRTPLGHLANSQWRDASGAATLAWRDEHRRMLTATYQRVQAEDAGVPGGSAFADTAAVTYRLAKRELFSFEYQVPNFSERLALLTARFSHQEIARNVEVVNGRQSVVTPHATHRTTSGTLEARIVPAPRQLLIVGGELWHRAVDSQREKYLLAAHKVVGDRPIPLAAYMSGGVFAQHEWNAVPGKVRVELGGRFDRSRTHNDMSRDTSWVRVNGTLQNIAPPAPLVMWTSRTCYDDSWNASAGVHVTPGAHVAFSALLATAYRSPSLEERYQYLNLGGAGGVHVGNPALAPERSVSLDLGARMSAGRTSAEAHVFGNSLTDLVADAPGTFQGAPAWVKTNIGKARLYGFELAGDQRLPHGFAARATAAYVRGEDTRLKQNLAQVSPLSGTLELACTGQGIGTARLTATAAHAQGNPAPGEIATGGWTTWGASLESAPCGCGPTAWTLRAGVENAFDRAYRLHLSTLRGLMKLEPGRNWYVALNVGRP